RFELKRLVLDLLRPKYCACAVDSAPAASSAETRRVTARVRAYVRIRLAPRVRTRRRWAGWRAVRAKYGPTRRSSLVSQGATGTRPAVRLRGHADGCRGQQGSRSEGGSAA